MTNLRRLAFGLFSSVLLSSCHSGDKNVHPSGTLEATEVNINSVLSGRAVSVRAELGTTVRAGDTLVVLDTDLLGLQRAQAAANRQALAAQRQVLRDQLAQAEATLELTSSNLARIRALAQEGTAAEQQLDDVKAKHDVATAQVAMVHHQIDANQVEEAKLDATLAVFDRQLRDGAMLAPVTGTVIMKSIENGETVTPAAVLMTLADLTKLELRVYLAETDLDRVKIGASYPVRVDALGGQELQGRVTWVSAEAEFTPKNAQTKAARTQQVYAAKLEILNSDGRLHIGMPAELIIP